MLEATLSVTSGVLCTDLQFYLKKIERSEVQSGSA
jgi:hypothetical protein